MMQIYCNMYTRCRYTVCLKKIRTATININMT